LNDTNNNTNGAIMKTKDHIEHIALFVDLDSFVGFCLGLGLPIELSPEIERLTKLGRIIIRRSFGDIYKLPIPPESKAELRKMLQHNQIQHEDIPYQNAFKNSSDIRLVVDALSSAFSNDTIDMFAVVANDRDYLPLFSKLREMGKNIIGIAGNKDITPDLYMKACDYFFYHETLTSNPSRTLEKDGSNTKIPHHNIDLEGSDLMATKFNKDDAVKLLVDAMTALDAKGSSIVAGSMVIQIMRRLKPDFDLNTYGFNNFKELCEYAAAANIIDIEHQGVIFNLQLKSVAMEHNQSITTPVENNNQTIESSPDQLHKWFENKVKIRLPDLSERKMIYERLFQGELYKDGISLLDLTKKVQSEITKSKTAQEACFKILYSLYRASCFSCSPGTTPYNPIVRGINASDDYDILDMRFIKNIIKVYTNENKNNVDPASWSELFFGSKDKAELIKENTLSL